MRLATAALKLQSDERLVKLAREAYEPAFEAIVERYRGPLERYACRMVDASRAEDLVQHAFTRLYLFLCEDERDLVLGPWLYRVTRNAAINVARERSHEEISENFDGVPQPPQVAEQRAHLRLVMGGLAELPERQRVAMVRRELEGRSYDEVAEELGVSGVGARQLVSRARIRLRDAVGLLIPLPLLRLGDVSAASGAGAAAGGAGAAAAGGAATAGGGTLTVAAAAGGGSAAQTIGAVVAVTAAVGASGAAVAPLNDTEREAPRKAAVTRAAPVKPTVSRVIRRPARAAETAPVLPAVEPPSAPIVLQPAEEITVDEPVVDAPPDEVEPAEVEFADDHGGANAPPAEEDELIPPEEAVVEESSPEGSNVLAAPPDASSGAPVAQPRRRGHRS